MKSRKEKSVPIIETIHRQSTQKSPSSYKSPDINKMQVVVIDHRTKIYIAVNADPVEARNRYLNRLETKEKEQFPSRKPVAS
jgi:hypothetical protein